MCALCGAFGAAEHWTDETGPATSRPSEAERRRRARIANEALGLYGLELKAWANRFTLTSRTGKSAVVDHFGSVWAEAERMTGRPCDPLDEATLDALEARRR